MWCWRSLLRVPWTVRRSNQSILKEISPECSSEGLRLKLKLQYFGHLMQRVHSLEKTDAGRDWGQEEKGTTEDEMAGWHHRLDGREFGWTPGVGNGQGGLACCNSWGLKQSDMTERLNWTEPTGVFPLPEHPGGLETLDECFILVYWYGRRYYTHMTWWPQWNVISGTWMNALKRTETPE